MNHFSDLIMSSFMQHILLMAFLSSLLTSFAAPLMEFNRLSGVAGSISHSILGGVGIALFLGQEPFLGALIFCCFVSFLLAYIKIHKPFHLERVSNTIWGGAMSLGVIFMFLTPGYQQNISNYLFGNLLLISNGDIFQALILNISAGFFIILFIQPLFVIMLNQDFAKIQKLPLLFLNTLIMMIVSFSLINLVKTLGIILSLILLSVPFNVAKKLTNRLFGLIVGTLCISFFSILTGLYFSYIFNLPSGSITALSCFLFYLLPYLKKYLFKKES